MSGAFELVDTYNTNVVIKVISVSENGDDAVRNIEKQIDGVDFVYFDAIENIREILNDTDMVFLIGATNDSNINETAEITSELDILTIAVVTKLHSFDTSKNITQLLCNELGNSITGITSLLLNPGMINVDLEDIRIIMLGKSNAISSSSSATGENRAMEAVQQAISSPIFADIDLKTASGVLVSISASNMGIMEFSEIGDIVTENLSENCTVKIGMSINPDLGDVMEVSVVAAFG